MPHITPDSRVQALGKMALRGADGSLERLTEAQLRKAAEIARDNPLMSLLDLFTWARYEGTCVSQLAHI